MITTLEQQLCVWKEMEQNPESSTFQEVRISGQGHKLYKCFECCGTQINHGVCENYYNLNNSLYVEEVK